VRLIEVAKLDFPLLRSQEDFDHGSPPEAIRPAQEAIAWADHLVILYPLWLGTLPALLKGFLEQVLRPDFAFTQNLSGQAGEEAAHGPQRPGGGHHGHAGLRLPLVLPRPQPEEPGAQCPEVLRHRPVRSSLIGMVEGGDGSVGGRSGW
jgi:multimeric flavodoxin WrbA